MVDASVKTLTGLRRVLNNIDRYKRPGSTIVITGLLYADMSRTFIALGKYQKDVTAAKYAAYAGFAVGSVATIFSGGLALPAYLAALASGGASILGSQAAVEAAGKEWGANAYAIEAMRLSRSGFKLQSNQPPKLIFRYAS